VCANWAAALANTLLARWWLLILEFGPTSKSLELELRRKTLLRTRVNNLEKLASLGAADPVPHVRSLDDEMVGGLPEANDDKLDYLRAKEVRGVR
jgi:hypothetical protein